MSSILTLHDLPAVERPRERLVMNGPASLSTIEVLALVLGGGVRGEPVLKLAERLLHVYGSLSGIAQASLEELQQLKGVGMAKACQLQACAEVARRMQRDLPMGAREKIKGPEQVYETLKSYVSDWHKEHYILVSMDARSRMLGVDVVSIGILDAALVHPRETFAAAIRRRAAKVLLCHNHPSGDVHPSDDDLVVTKRLVTAGKILGIAVIDHLIIGRESFYSMQTEGVM